MVIKNKIPRSSYLRLVTLQSRLKSVTKEFQSLRDKGYPCYLSTHELEQCCYIFNGIVGYVSSEDSY